MKAVLFDGKGGPEIVRFGETPDPAPARGEVLVRVRAAALNRADLLQRRGLYPPPPGTREDIPGLELAGEVAAVGAGVTAWKPGDRVMAIASGEAQAELAVAHERMLVRIPDALSFEDAAAIPEACVTSHDALFTLGGLRPGWPVLVHAVGSGRLHRRAADREGGRRDGDRHLAHRRQARAGARARARPRHPRREGRAQVRRRGQALDRESAAVRSSSTSSARPTPRRTSPRSRPAAASW